ncbi:hypothetical protein FN846DRAFT_951520, partial [Sphaerosporella brunnea]
MGMGMGMVWVWHTAAWPAQQRQKRPIEEMVSSKKQPTAYATHTHTYIISILSPWALFPLALPPAKAIVLGSQVPALDSSFIHSFARAGQLARIGHDWPGAVRRV